MLEIGISKLSSKKQESGDPAQALPAIFGPADKAIMEDSHFWLQGTTDDDLQKA